MKTNLLTLLSVALLALMTFSCTTPSSPVVTTSGDSDIHGYVELWDSCGGQDSNLEGVVVTATSSTWTGTDTTSVDGTWSIGDAPAGVYSISSFRGAYMGTTITNLQYVGTGKFDVQKVSLTAAVPANYVSSASIDSAYWAYEMRTLENGSLVKADSTYIVKVSVATKCARTSPLDYRITESADADCHSFVVAGVSDVENNGTLQTVNLGSAYRKLVQYYGSSLTGKHLYLQIRNKQLGKRPDGTVGCLDPVVVDLYY